MKTQVKEIRRSRRIPGQAPWVERPSPFARVFRFLFLVGSVAVVVVPFWAVIATSLSSQRTLLGANGGMVLWTSEPTLEAYRALLSGGVVTRAIAVSVGITVVGTVLSLASTTGLAYWLARPRSPGSRTMVIVVLGAVLFSPGMIPTYLLVRQMGLLDSYWSLILPVLVNAFNVIVMRAFFQELANELYEAAEIDGASTWQVFRLIALPLSKAIMAVIGLFYAVAYWNSFFNAMLYLQSSEKWPIALVLRQYVVNQSTIGGEQVAVGTDVLPPQLALQMAILTMSMIPIVCVYPFLQRHFAKGLMIGAVKG